ncbi:MAG: hydrogenase maturation protease [Gammaproteobacteria bacterium]|nr:hydrogenase maturation protease [Gammaproteobacteria bacterium]MDE1983864.1 hydrogenase maturation protease [Gammaproteobacteria bacterium]MDE2108020.1 hydrogenase maturation protease [Gammaproteobacteria bacterium]MDE2459656.1 hydrogenase maturation protease [Gammaproteobacteria bacterium]
MHAVAELATLDLPQPAAATRALPASFVVLGICNPLLGDDGAGVQVVRQLRAARRPIPRVRLLDGGIPSVSLLETVENTPALIVVNTAHLQEPPGTVRVLQQGEMDEFLRDRTRSGVHELSLAELLDRARLTGRLPAWRAFVGIQPEHVAAGTELSPAVSAGLKTACIHVRALIARWSI